MNKFRAFTLAETLIVMGIIGFIAAISVPRLRDGMDERTLVAQLGKIDTDIQTSYQAVITRYNDITSVETWEYAGLADANAIAKIRDLLGTRLADNLSAQKKCGTSTGCFTSDSTIDSSTSYQKMILKNGAALALTITSKPDFTCSTAENRYYPCPFGSVIVDVNGNETGPNKAGYDIFAYTISKNGIEPNGLDETNGVVLSSTDGKQNTAWALKAQNEDYNNAASSNGGSMTCKNGTVLNWKTQRTCK